MKKAAWAPAMLAAGLAVAWSTAPARSAGENPLEEARRAAEAASFSGVIRLRWTDAAGAHEERMTVEAGGGALVVHGGKDVMAGPGPVRMVQDHSRKWALLWTQHPPAPRPPLGSKYDTLAFAGPAVAGRPTNVIEIRQRGVLRERLYLDAATGLLLRREQFPAAGPPGTEATRTVGFEVVALEPAPGPGARAAAAPVVPPRPPSDFAPRPVAPAKLGVRYRAPEVLDDGYRRLGIYRRADVVHVAYSDGVYDLSVFEQPGRLDRGDLPKSAEVMDIGEVPAWRYTWAGGHVVVWEGRHAVYAAVSDAPLDHVLKAVRSIPAGEPAAQSLLSKLRRACRALVQPLSG